MEEKLNVVMQMNKSTTMIYMLNEDGLKKKFILILKKLTIFILKGN